MAQLERKKSACVKILSEWEDNGPIFSKIMAVPVYRSEAKEQIYVVITKNE